MGLQTNVSDVYRGRNGPEFPTMINAYSFPKPKSGHSNRSPNKAPETQTVGMLWGSYLVAAPLKRHMEHIPDHVHSYFSIEFFKSSSNYYYRNNVTTCTSN